MEVHLPITIMRNTVLVFYQAVKLFRKHTNFSVVNFWSELRIFLGVHSCFMMSDFVFHCYDMLESFAEKDLVVSRKCNWRNFLVFIIENELTCGFNPAVCDYKISVDYLLQRKSSQISLILNNLLWVKDNGLDSWTDFECIQIF